MTDRKKLIAGNWKMNATHLEAIQKIQKLSYRIDVGDYDRVEVVVAPPFTALRSVQTVIEADHLPIQLAAQDVHWEANGAYTGEISAEMLAKLSVKHVVVGHSERRAMFGDTDETVNQKAKAVLAAGMVPIVCVGETLDQREEGQTHAVVEGQAERSLAGLDPADLARSAVAYEPVWAIGTGRTASPDDAAEVIDVIRGKIRSDHGDEPAEAIRILYGGSVNAGNIKDIMAKRGIDGVLVGGASLDPDSFSAIVRYWI
jgi:triosephosphate isomerase (TIM)